MKNKIRFVIVLVCLLPLIQSCAVIIQKNIIELSGLNKIKRNYSPFTSNYVVLSTDQVIFYPREIRSKLVGLSNQQIEKFECDTITLTLPGMQKESSRTIFTWTKGKLCCNGVQSKNSETDRLQLGPEWDEAISFCNNFPFKTEKRKSCVLAKGSLIRIAGNQFLYSGGQTEGGEFGFQEGDGHSPDTAVLFNVSTKMMKRLQLMQGRYYHSSVCIGKNKVLIVGGINYESEFPFTNVEVLDIATGKSKLLDLKLPPITSFAVCSSDLNSHLIYLAGGYTEEDEYNQKGNLNIYEFDISKETMRLVGKLRRDRAFSNDLSIEDVRTNCSRL